ncbi:hypothetical protein [Saccharothrix lopnurensis]|uniref:Uncharacterized protein n=1 Tax=Saccharothrix lopnurensis TaxID=1670621 RepID=A0ABW1P9M3_9PSEU
MSVVVRRAVQVTSSVVTGTVVAVLVNLITQGWSWPTAAGLVVAVVVAVVVEWWRGGADTGASGAEDRVTITAAEGSVAMGRDNTGSVTISGIVPRRPDDG